MYQKNNFVYLHLQKTAGTHIKKLLVEVFGEADENSVWHGRVTEEHKDKFVFCGVRNPWDFYVSLFHHSQQKIAPPVNYFRSVPGLFDKTYDNPDTVEGFRIWLECLLSGKILDRNTMKLPKRLLNKPGKHVLLANKVDKMINHKSEDTIGLMSRWFFAMSVPNYRQMRIDNYKQFEKKFEELSLIDSYYRMELLADDIHEIIKNNLNPSVGWEEKFNDWSNQKSNTSKRIKKYEAYYDNELAAKVAEKDELIIKKFNYEF